MQPADFPGFRRLFDDLLRFGLSRRVPFHDAEDLVGSTIESSLKHFDATKGAFRPLCFTILSNLIKNYWRDRKQVAPFPDDAEPGDPDWEEGFAWFKNEAEKARLEAIMAELTTTERNFLVQLRDVFDEMEDRAVSEASRRLGLEPQKGWDIFRQIQRKAQKLSPEPKYPRTASMKISAPRTGRESLERTESVRRVQLQLSSDVRLLAKLTAGYTSFGRFLGKFPEDSATSIESLLS
jgi:DNA-directed RNA polymerase specialized sigma24 family protein